MINRVIGVLVTIAMVYLVIDFFLWNGGILEPAIITRIAELTN